MKNYTNIYDIDGNLIRKAGDNHKFTLDEVEKMVDDLAKKVQDNPDNKVYKVYLNNANAHLFNMYNSMHPEELQKRLTTLQDSIQKAKDMLSEEEKANIDKINEHIDELKHKYESGTKLDSEVEHPVEEPTPIVMDEYVEFEEV